MKVLFVIQGEGRGHFTQAIALKRMLEANGHEIVRVLVGKSPSRQLPDFFSQKVTVPTRVFSSPNFLPSAHNKKVNLFRTVIFNISNLGRYLKSLHIVRKEIDESGADIVVNFYELITGLVYTLYKPKVKMIAVAHQYVFLHRKFKFPGSKAGEFRTLNFFSLLTSRNAVKRLALSFYTLPPDPRWRIEVVPPLLRKEILEIKSEEGDYLHGYMLNSGFSEEIIEWHKAHPQVPVHFFWDKKDVPEALEIDKNLTFHKLDDRLFIKYMAGCKGYATTAGFESVCEALYLRKPVMMVPTHIEQECNAFDAKNVEAGISTRAFNLTLLLDYIPNYKPNETFRLWVKEAEFRILAAIKP